jgi:hypothetical protein
LNVDQRELAGVAADPKYTPRSAPEEATPDEPAGKESRPIV